MTNVSCKTRRLAASHVAMMASLMLAGCGGEMGTEEVATQTRAIRCHDAITGAPSTDPACPWRAWSQLLPATSANEITHTQSPALCVKADSDVGFLTVSVDTSNKYRMLQWNNVSRGVDWLTYDAKAFASKPACTMREDGGPGQPGFVVAGKGTDNKIYTSAGKMAAFATPPATQANPSQTTGFSALNGTVFTTGGLPALATGSSSGSGVLMVYMKDDSRTIRAHVRDLPYLSNAWTAGIDGPVLPTGWTVSGSPAVDALPITFHIVVHAVNGTTHRMFETHFYKNGSTRHFSNLIGSPASTWTMLGDMGSIVGGPSLTNSNAGGYETVYFLRGTQIMQTSQLAAGTPVMAVPGPGISFNSAPAGVTGFPFEEASDHMVIARSTTNHIYFMPNRVDPSGYVVGP